MDQQQAFGGVIDVLEAIGARYAIWGGWAVVAHGEPRFTMDMDILLSPDGFLNKLFVQRLGESGYQVDEVSLFNALAGGYQDEEVSLFNALAGGYFNVIHLASHVKVDFFVPGHDSPQQRVIQERVYLPFDEIRRAAYVSAEALVITKLQVYAESESTRHLDDIASVIRIQGERLDNAQIDVVAARLGLLGVWRALWTANRPPEG
jgi:hypothetical protein